MYKKISILFLLAILFKTADAQMAIGGRAVYIGGKLGVNVTTVGKNPGVFMGSFGVNKKDKERGYDVSGRFKAGIQAGVILDFPATEKLSVQPGVIFSQYGCRMKVDATSSEIMKASVTLNYIQIPLTFQHKKERIRSARLIQAGPYIGMGLGGKLKEKYTENGKLTYSGGWQIPMGGNKEIYDYQRLDFGISAGFGYQFRSVQAVASYNFGLNNINMKSSKFSPRVYNSGVSLTLTFL